MTQAKQKTYSDWLVVSDIDGTLNNKFRHLPQRNFDAIQKFTKELDGNFTLASGRSVASMKKHYKRLNLNTPAVILNGAGIYDFEEEKMLYYRPISEAGQKIVENVYRNFPLVEILIVANDRNYLLHSRIFAPIMANADPLKDLTFNHFEKVPRENWGKVIFLGFPTVITALRKYLEGNDNSDVTFMASSISSFEMLEKNTNKGSGVLKVAEIIGVDKEKTAAIGDYFNDYEMLKHVGLPACCGQAPSGMKEIAKVVTCHCNKGAVADLLEYIENNY